MNGFIDIKISPGTYNYKEELDRYLNQADKVYKKLHVETKKIKKDF